MTYNTLDDYAEVKLRVATDDDMCHQAFDNTRMTALNTCPTWGIMRYGHHKRMPGEGRAMALEAGKAMHDVFAAARLWQLWKHQELPAHTIYHGLRIFGDNRWQAMLCAIDEREDSHQQMRSFCLEALETSGFYDDPNDRRRTLANLEECAIAYLDRYDWRLPVWVQDKSDETAMVGIEISFNVVVEFVPKHGLDAGEALAVGDTVTQPRTYRFTGRIDGIHDHGDKFGICPHEEKTASRLGDAWAESFVMAHQVTGYCLAFGVVSQGMAHNRAYVHGLSIPLPRAYDYGGIITLPVSRGAHAFHEWFEWFLHTVQIHEQWHQRPHEAPKYTHSCNRYFRPCPLISFCGVEPEERKGIIEEMDTVVWDPLDDGAVE